MKHWPPLDRIVPQAFAAASRLVNGPAWRRNSGPELVSVRSTCGLTDARARGIALPQIRPGLGEAGIGAHRRQLQPKNAPDLLERAAGPPACAGGSVRACRCGGARRFHCRRRVAAARCCRCWRWSWSRCRYGGWRRGRRIGVDGCAGAGDRAGGGTARGKALIVAGGSRAASCNGSAGFGCGTGTRTGRGFGGRLGGCCRYGRRGRRRGSRLASGAAGRVAGHRCGVPAPVRASPSPAAVSGGSKRSTRGALVGRPQHGHDAGVGVGDARVRRGRRAHGGTARLRRGSAAAHRRCRAGPYM